MASDESNFQDIILGGNVTTICRICGACVVDFMAAEGEYVEGDYLRPYQVKHLQWHRSLLGRHSDEPENLYRVTVADAEAIVNRKLTSEEVVELRQALGHTLADQFSDTVFQLLLVRAGRVYDQAEDDHWPVPGHLEAQRRCGEQVYESDVRCTKVEGHLDAHSWDEED